VDTYTLKRHVGKDGVLRIELPVGVSETDVEVIIIVQPSITRKVKGNQDGLARSHEPWTEEEQQQLLKLYHAGENVDNIAKQHQRTSGAIHSRLKKLGIDILGS